jgi:hypothetical protein
MTLYSTQQILNRVRRDENGDAINVLESEQQAFNAVFDPATNALRVTGLGSYLLTFAYGDATPEVIFTCAAGDTIARVELSILTAFDGAGAALTVGDAGDIDRLMTAASNIPGTVGTYTTHPLHTYAAATAIALYITPGGGASAGNGFVKIFVK